MATSAAGVPTSLMLFGTSSEPTNRRSPAFCVGRPPFQHRGRRRGALCRRTLCQRRFFQDARRRSRPSAVSSPPRMTGLGAARPAPYSAIRSGSANTVASVGHRPQNPARWQTFRDHWRCPSGLLRRRSRPVLRCRDSGLRRAHGQRCKRAHTPKRHHWWLAVIGRLKPGWTLAQARAHVRAISPGLFEATLPPNYTPETAKSYLGLKLTAYPAGSGVSDLRSRLPGSFVDPAGHRGSGVGDCLRQPRKPHVGPRQRPRTRTGRPPGHRRIAAAPDSPDARREPAARRHRSRLRSLAGAIPERLSGPLSHHNRQPAVMSTSARTGESSALPPLWPSSLACFLD